jgi:hypothetical protein
MLVVKAAAHTLFTLEDGPIRGMAGIHAAAVAATNSGEPCYPQAKTTNSGEPAILKQKLLTPENLLSSSKNY